MLNRPLLHQIKVLAFMMGAEVRKRPHGRRIGPHLAEQTRVGSAHDLLPQNVDAVCKWAVSKCQIGSIFRDKDVFRCLRTLKILEPLPKQPNKRGKLRGIAYGPRDGER